MSITWILEREMYGDYHDRLHRVLIDKGLDVLDWNDEWKNSGEFPILEGQKVIFHGSLGNAALIKNMQLYDPGVYCNVENFKCTSWYPETKRYLFQKDWKLTTVKELVKCPDQYLEHIESNYFFVRPNSPLKPFSGRVLSKDSITLKALDFGYYYDNDEEEVIVASLQKMKQEWRYIVCGNKIVTGSSYIAGNRAADDKDWQGRPLELAQKIARNITSPDDVYVLDICDSQDGLKLLELNPFSGADLYNCDRGLIVNAVSKFLNINNK